MRRQVLRELHADFAVHSVAELASALGLNPRAVEYHGDVLAGWGKIKKIDGPRGRLLESLATEDPEVTAVLLATRLTDRSRHTQDGREGESGGGWSRV